jgi:hypothetical protein
MVQEPLTDAELLEKAAYTARRMHDYLARGRGSHLESRLATATGQAQQSLTDLLEGLHQETSQK